MQGQTPLFINTSTGDVLTAMDNPQTWKPNKFLALFLGLFINSFALLYVARPAWSIFYLLLPLVIIAAEALSSAPWFPGFSLGILAALGCAVHAYFVASRGTAPVIRPWYSRWYGIASLYISFFILVFIFRAFAYEPFRMPSGSMLPTIPVGSYLIVDKRGYGNYGTYDLRVFHTGLSSPIERGDIIVFDYPEDESIQYVKRVIGLPGDILHFKDRQLTINGVNVTESSDNPVSTDAYLATQPHTLLRESHSATSYYVVYIEGAKQLDFEVVVPAQSYFVLGDNRDNSRDSRFWGFVPETGIVGKVIKIIPRFESVN